MKTINKIKCDSGKRARLQLRLELALADKFKQGVELHGTEWSGDDPLIEAFDDILDTIIYLRIAKKHYNDFSPLTDSDELIEQLEGIADHIACACIDAGIGVNHAE